MSAATRVSINRESCRGYANCVLAAPDVFDIDADGLAILLLEEVPENLTDAVERAIYDCPTDSIALEPAKAS